MTAPQGIIWDLDGTLYQYHAAKRDVFCRAAAQAARVCGVREDEEQIFNTIMCATHSHALVETWQQEHGLDRKQFHLVFHEIIDVTCVSEPVVGLVEALQRVALAQVILTHASRTWAQRMLTHLGLSRFFPDNRVIAFEDVGLVGKHCSPAPFARALEVLDLPASRAVMVEDTPANLVHAHALGMTTVLIHHGQPLGDPLPDHIQAQHETAADFIASVVPRRGGGVGYARAERAGASG